ncbi:MAG: MBL fold metallo-hydrolase [Treponema sp.]|nr:MBL fold metallo-hydrolase [Treponema sp.]
MKVFFHYCTYGFSNCYILGAEKDDRTGTPGIAVIIDPGNMDEQILNFIENNEYSLKAVLLTHDHINHVRGLKTLKRIYNTEIYAVNHVIMDHKTNLVRDGDVVGIGPFSIAVISIPGHSSDSAVFRVERLLFTGDALTAGLVGRTVSSYGAVIQMNALRSRILSLPGDFTILPGHGPPSSLEVERRFNMGVKNFDETKTRRTAFRVDL